MHKVYDRWPEIADEAYHSEFETAGFVGIDHIVFTGMGGSGALGDIFEAILSRTNIHVSVVKGYLLPKTVDADTLVVTTSVSGNTVETLSTLNLAKEKDCKIIGFSSGGKMESYCLKNKIEYRKIQEIHSPRASFTVFLYSMLKILHETLPVEESDIKGSISSLREIQRKISSNNLNNSNPSLELAKWITDIPLIYYPWGLQAAAIRFKNSLQENAKMHAITEDVIEACHNGIVSWEKRTEIKPILMQGVDDYIKTKERWNILQEFFDDKKVDYKIVKSVEGGILTKLINLIYLLDYASIYKAILTKVDPTVVQPINYVKSKLNED
ncbi:glucose-6-phosphate isomerase [Nitrosopumilus sp. b1]|uniref:SIS domain-containing protein n=1 Tax=Nitrosopumilus sp. b1 TaxID=2109907 RepID=UPI0015F68797|nr:SIS domain-containing protein [Nitrosopumilus sp. b1]KAF6243993.1 glucose-6-phosphate isomerase [Nitrosopumilus sp. b1]